MAGFMRLVLAGLLFIAVLVGGAYLLRRYISNATAANEESSEERKEHEQRMQDYSLPLRSKFGQMPTPVKFMFAGVLIIIGVIAYEVYQFAKTGSPTQIWYAQKTQLFVVGGIASVAGISYERKRAAKEGKATAKIENDEGELQNKKTIYFNVNDTIETSEGTVIFEYSRSRVLGLYRRAKAIVEDRELRQQAVFRPSDDKIGHLVPENATWIDDQTIEWRTKDDTTETAEGKPYDYRYLPPFTKSRQQYRKIRSKNEMLKDEIEEKRIRIANFQSALDQLEEDLEQAHQQGFDQVVDRVQKLQQITNPRPQQYNLERTQDTGRSGRDDGDADTDGIAAGNPGSNGAARGGDR